MNYLLSFELDLQIFFCYCYLRGFVVSTVLLDQSLVYVATEHSNYKPSALFSVRLAFISWGPSTFSPYDQQYPWEHNIWTALYAIPQDQIFSVSMPA